MYFTDIKDITILFLANAAYVLSLRTDAKGGHPFKLRSIHVDPSGECAISYYGRLTEFQIKEIMVNYCYPMEDKSMDEINPQLRKDYVYQNGHHANGETEYTTVFTPDGLNYRNLKI